MKLQFSIFLPMKTLKTASLKAGYSRTDHRCASLCTDTNIKFVTFLFWTALKTNYTSKCSDFQKKLIDIITTSNFYLKFKENNENDMAAQVFWAVYYSSDGQAKLAQQLILMVLPFHPLMGNMY